MTKDDFIREHDAFREIMGSREIMMDLDRRGAALKGFMFVAIRLEREVREEMKYIIEANVDEFVRRCEYADAAMVRDVFEKALG